MKKTLWIILALVMALTLVIGSVSTVSANTTLPSLNVALTNVTGDSDGGYYENITCIARMVEVLPEYPATGGTAKGRFSWTFGGGSKYGSQAYHITGNIIYLSVGEVSGRKAAWVTVEITQQNLEYPQYLIVLFDENKMELVFYN